MVTANIPLPSQTPRILTSEYDGWVTVDAARDSDDLVGSPLALVDLESSPSIRVQGKGRRERCLPLWKQTATDSSAEGPIVVGTRGHANSRGVFARRSDR